LSLIADSLKKALEDKAQEKRSVLQFNLLSRSDESKGSGSSGQSEFKRAMLLIGLPGIILAGMIYGGAFDSQGAKIANLSIWETLGLKKKAPRIRPLPKVASQPAPKPQPAPAPTVTPPAPQPAGSAPVAIPAPPPVASVAPVPVERTVTPEPSQKTMEARMKPAQNIEVAEVFPPAEIPIAERPAIEKRPSRSEIKSIIEKPKVKKVAPQKSLFQTEVNSLPEKKEDFESSSYSMKPAEKNFNDSNSGAMKEPTQSPRENTYQERSDADDLKMRSKVSVNRGRADSDSMYAPEAFEASERSRIRPERTPPNLKEPVPNVFKNSSFYFNRAVFYQQSKEWEKALQNYSKAAELNPDNPNIYNNMGVIYKELGKYDLAVNEFLQAVYLDPEYGKVYNNLGVVYFLKMNYAGAVRNYQKAIEIDPSNMGALNNLATSYKAQGEFGNAREVLNRALKLDPDHPGTNYNLAVLYETERNLETAKHYYWRFLELGENDHPALAQQVKRHLETLK